MRSPERIATGVMALMLALGADTLVHNTPSAWAQAKQPGSQAEPARAERPTRPSNEAPRAAPAAAKANEQTRRAGRKPEDNRKVAASRPATAPATVRSSADESGATRAREPSAQAAAKRGQLTERKEAPRTAPATAVAPPLKTVQVRAPEAKEPAAEVEAATVTPSPDKSEKSEPLRHIDKEDLSLRMRVQKALMQDRNLPYSARSVSVDANHGEITLRGELNNEFDKARVRRAVEQAAGAHLVHDELEIRNSTNRAVP